MANTDNPGAGAAFELLVQEWLDAQGILTALNMDINVGAASIQRPHRFDMGSSDPPILVECKRHTWTKGGNSPSAKLTIWKEAMHYFACVPNQCRMMLLVLRSLRNDESLARYYIRRYGHLVPRGAELWEFDEQARHAEMLLVGV